MPEPHWTSYVGMGTGIFGCFSGITGAIVAIVSYRKSKQIKALDLRIELKRAAAKITHDFKKLREQMEKGNTSRKNILAARGMLGSSNMDDWKKHFELDQKTVNKLKNELPGEETDYDGLDAKGLEDELIKLHKKQITIESLSEKYTQAMAQDSEQRKELREDRRTLKNRLLE